MHQIFINHHSRYPHWAVEDLYKLIHQAALGCEHVLKDEVQARERLLCELAELSSGPEEPLIETISPDGQILRVHLRPYARMRFDSRLLLEAFFRTAREFRGSTAQVEEYCMTAARLAQDGTLPFDHKDLTGFITMIKKAAFPPVHHSAVFRAEYRPAYRVVGRQFLPGELLTVASTHFLDH